MARSALYQSLSLLFRRQRLDWSNQRSKRCLQLVQCYYTGFVTQFIFSFGKTKKIRGCEMLELTEEQKIFEKLYLDLYQVISKAGFKHVQHGDKFICASSEYKNKIIEVKISIK